MLSRVDWPVTDSPNLSDNFDLFNDDNSIDSSIDNSDSKEYISPLFGRDITKSDRTKLREAEQELIANPISSPYSIPISRDEAIAQFQMETGMKRGRPTKLTPDRHKFIIDKVREGVPDKVACQLAGCHEDSINQWDQNGKRHIRAGKDTVFARFSIDLKIARSELEARLAVKWAKIAVEPTTKRKRVYKEQIVTKNDGTTEAVRYLDSDTIEEIGDGNWQAGAEYLSRRFPERWKKQQTIEKTGPDGGPIQIQQATIDINALSMEARELLLGEIKKKLAELGPSPGQKQLEAKQQEE